MNRDQFEAKVLEMWLTTRIPMTRANLQFWTGTSRKSLTKRLDEAVSSGMLETDVDDDGELFWKVLGAARSATGPTVFPAAGAPAGRAAAPTDAAGAALALARLSRGLESARGAALRPTGPEERSMIVGAGLGLLGPLGWLYAGSLKETLPAIVVAALLWNFLPTLLLMPLLMLALPASAVVGALYAWKFNKAGARQSLFLDKQPEPGDP